MREKVLITGASGFVGYHLINEALKQDYEVVAAVREGSKIDHLEGFNISYTFLDYRSVEALKSDIEKNKYSYIIHAAGITKAKNITVYNEVNAEFTRNLAIAASLSNYPVKKFVLVSSLAAIGPLQELTRLLDERTIPNPVTDYGRSKLLAEQHLMSIQNLTWVGIRPTAVYGPREKDLFVLFKSISKGFDLHIGRFRQQLSFIYVKDLALVILNALTNTAVKEFYNVSDGNVYSRYELADTTKKLLKVKAARIHLPVSAVHTLASLMERIYRNRKDTPVLNKEKMNELTAMNWGCDISKIQQDLNFKPKYNLEDGLSETLVWYKENRWL